MKKGRFLIAAAVFLAGATACGTNDGDVYGSEFEGDAVPVPEEFQVEQELGSSGRGTIFLNFEGATIRRGRSSSQQNTSFIVQGQSGTVPAFNHSRYGSNRQQIISQLVELVREDYVDYDVEIVTQRPTSGDYTMVMVGGTKNLLNDPSIPSGVVGIAPLDTGNGNRNDIVFAFSDSLRSLADLATCISHEAGHSFGLQHMQPRDAYMFPSLRRRPLRWVNDLIFNSNRRQDQDGILNALFGKPVANPNAPSEPEPAPQPPQTDGNNAQFVAQDVPSQLFAGQLFSASLSFTNTGETDWDGASGYGMVSPNRVWGGDSLIFPTTIARGQTRTIRFTARAPSEPGTYDFVWSISENKVAFGTASPLLRIRVLPR